MNELIIATKTLAVSWFCIKLYTKSCCEYINKSIWIMICQLVFKLLILPQAALIAETHFCFNNKWPVNRKLKTTNGNGFLAHVLATVEFHVPPINVPTFSPFIAFEMLPGWLKLKTTTATRKEAQSSKCCFYLVME